MANDRNTIEVRDVLLALGKRPGLRFEVARNLAGLRLAGPWVGPKLTTRTQFTQECTLREWHREAPGGTIVAAISKDENPAEESTSGPWPHEWGACPTHPVPGDGFSPFEFDGKVAHHDEAMALADAALRSKGYMLADGQGLLAGPWLRRGNHSCRDILYGSLRHPDMNRKVAVVREMPKLTRPDGTQALGTTWRWGVMPPDDDLKTLGRGRQDTEVDARAAADEVLLQHGWSLVGVP